MKYNWRLDLEELKSLYEQGFSCEQIGRIVGASRQAIWGKLTNAGVILRKKALLPYILYDGIKFTLSRYGYYRATERKRHISLHRYKYIKEVGNIPDDYDVHHIDGNKQNNDIKNLMAMPKAEHSKLHDQIRKHESIT